MSFNIITYTNSEILKTLDDESINVISNDFKPIDFINVNGRTTLMLACMCGLLDKIIEIHNINNNIINKVDNLGYNIFIIACCYNYTDICLWLLDNTNIDINAVTVKGFTGFIYSCQNNNMEISSKILDKGFINVHQKTFSNITALDAISDKCMYNIVYRILTLTIQKPNIEKKFIVYSKEDFLEISNDEVNHGTYGLILNVITKDNTKLLLKKYLKKTERIISPSTLKEIYFLKKINSLSDITVNLHGIYIDDNNDIYLVMEPLLYQLNIIFEKLCAFEYYEYYKGFFYNILYLIHTMNSFGIIHNDLKHNNIMIDKYNNIKLIDFGFAEFLGVGCSSDLVDNYRSTSYIKAPDSDINSINRKSYNSDIYSVGILFLQAFLSKKGKRYYIDKNNKICCNNKILNLRKLIKIPYLLDLIYGMLNNNSYERFNTIDCLKHDFFKQSIETPIVDYKITILKYDTVFNNKNYISKYLVNKYVKYKDIDIKNNKYEIPYLNQIINNYIKSTYLIFKYQINLKNLDYILSYLFNLNFNIDSIFNIIIFLRLNKLKNTISVKTYIYIVISIFESYINTFNLPKLLLDLDITDIKEFENQILSTLNIGNINYYPIMIYVQYIIINLQKLNIDNKVIFMIETFLIKYIFKILIFYPSVLNIPCMIFEYFIILSKKLNIQISYDIFFKDIEFTIENKEDLTMYQKTEYSFINEVCGLK